MKDVVENTKSSKLISSIFKFVFGVLNDTYGFSIYFIWSLNNCLELRYTGPYSYVSHYREVEQFKHLRKRFFDVFVLFLRKSGYFDQVNYFILFLKYLSQIMQGVCQDREVGQTLSGAELFRSVFISIHQYHNAFFR